MRKIKCILSFVFLTLLAIGMQAQNPEFALSSGVQTTVGETVEVQLSVNTDLSPHNVLSYTFAFSYNAGLLKVKNVQYDTKLLSFTNVANTQQSGKITLAGASTIKAEGTGTLVTIRFEALAAGYAPLNFITAECVLNEGTPPSTYQNGNITVAPKPAIVISPNTAFLAIGQTIQCNLSGNKTPPYTWGLTNPAVGNISAGGLFTATGHGKTRVFVKDATALRDTTDGFIEVTAVSLSFPAGLQQWQNWEVEIPVKTSDFSSINVLSGQFALTYRADVLKFIGITKTGTLLENASVSAGETANGKMNLSFAASQPIGNQTNDLIKLRFKVLPAATAATNISFSDVVFNEEIAAFTENGTFTPKLLPTLTLTPTSASLVAGDSLQFTVANGNVPYTWTVSDSRVATVRQNGWLIAREGGLVNITVTDAVGATKTVSNIIVADMRMNFSVDTLERINSITETRCLVDSVPAGRPAVTAIEGEISVSNTNVKIIGIETNSTFTQGWQKQIVRVSDQRIKFYLAGATPFRQKGVAFLLKTELLPGFKEYDRTDILFHSLLLNEGTPDPKTINGSIEGKLFTEQDKTICLSESTGVLTIPNADGKTITRWKKRVRRPVPTNWVNVNITTATYTDTPDRIGEWEYVATVNGVDTKVANILVNTIPDVSGVIRGQTIFCNIPHTQRYVVEPRPTATEYRWTYTGSGVVLHPNKNILDLEITNEVTPGTLEMRTANACGESVQKLTLTLAPTIQPASYTFDNTITYYDRDTVSFTDTSVGALAWYWAATPATGWEFTDGTTANSQHPKIKFTQAGVYTVKLKATNSCRIDSVMHTVTINEFKYGELSVNKTSGCLGATFRFELTQTTGVVQAWQVQKDSETTWTTLTASAVTTYDYTPTTAGIYKIRVKLAEDRGYSSMATITVYPIPEKPVIVKTCTEMSVAFSDGTVSWFKEGEYTTAVHTGNTFTPTLGISYVAQTTNIGSCQSSYSDPAVISKITGTDVVTACETFTWIDGNTYTSDNNTATYNLVGGAKNGCDSLVTLNLTVIKINAAVTVADFTITATETGAQYQWYKNNVAIEGADTRIYTAVQDGTYKVKITKNGCEKTSAEIVITGTSVTITGADLPVKIYPNPTDKEVKINLGGIFSRVQVSVYNSLGVLIMQQTVVDCKETSLPLTGEKGVYLLKIKADDKPEVVMKAVKK